MTPTPDWLGAEEALTRILGRCVPLPIETLDLVRDAEDLGSDRALASDVFAEVDHPPWDNSAMDGFAVRAEDVRSATSESPVVLPVSENVPAGTFPSSPLARGSAVRVMTGAPVPEGATGVIRIEHTDGGERAVTVREASDAERNIRRRGEDLRRGDLVAARGTAVTPAVVGCLAMQCARSVDVHRRPRIGVLANGDELADFDEVDEVRAGRRIMNSNSHALAAQVRAAGALPIDLGIASDTAESVRAGLDRGTDCDGIISSAGVSVGDHDQVKRALDEAGFERDFWRVRIRPGSPMTFGTLGGRPFWGLPGNPVSAMVTFEMFVRPALRRFAGHDVLQRRRLTAEAAEAIRSPGGLTHFYRVKLAYRGGNRPLASLTGPQGSGILTSMIEADGLAVLPEDRREIPAGGSIEVILLGDA
ncbi:MAG: molybdopterin molybdotransferase MoeA [Gemmatimonadota bacterium]